MQALSRKNSLGHFTQGKKQIKTVFSYFKGQPENWETGLPTYSDLLYKDLWLGIDLIFHGTTNPVATEFHL